jgi:hypothetical protein
MGCSPKLQETDIIPVNLNKTGGIACVIENVIPLETTDEALIGRNNSFTASSRNYVVGDGSKIIVYSKQGKVKGIISPVGNGPDELAYIHDFYATDTSIMIMDAGKKRIMEFDFNSRFVASYPVDDVHHTFACFKGFYLFDNQAPASEKGNVLSIADRTGKIVRDTVTVIAEGISYGRNKFQIFEDYALYLPTASNIIYKIDKSANVSSACQLDFGEYWLDAEICSRIVADSKGDAFALWKYLANHDKIGFLNFFDTREWLFLNFEKQSKRYNWYYNKANKEQYLIECDGSSAPACNIVGVENKKFIAALEADDYLNLTAAPKLDNLKFDDNFVIVIFDMEKTNDTHE